MASPRAAPPTTSITFKQVQKANEWTAIYFAVAMSGLITILIFSHWTSILSHRHSPKSNSHFMRTALYVTRGVRSVILLKVPFYPSLGHAVVFVLYLATNITLCFHGLDWSNLFSFAKRLGWMATCNIALVTFLALKNTPLAFLTAYSYERLNTLHRMAGYCTVIFSLLHGIVFIIALSKQHALSDLLEDANIMGVVAGASMLSILVSALILRKWTYEVFYVVHITLFMLILIAVGMHRPDITLKAVFIIIFAASIWFCDRAIRFARIAWNTFGNNASVTPFVRGGVRVVVRRTPRYAVPGSHVFLWIPKIRATETHPFTIVSTNPLELVVSAHDGFTKDLFSYAYKNPGTTIRASVDGPYGTLPNFTAFDQIILIAGGSGASFTFGVATNLVNKLRNTAKRPLVNFIWVVREPENLTWYTKELESLLTSRWVKITIYCTRSTAATITNISLDTMPDKAAANDEKTSSGASISHNTSYEEQSSGESDIEKAGYVRPIKSVSPNRMPEIRSGRPDIAALIPYIVEGTESHERILVAACGPDSLMLTTRSTVASIVGAGRQSITLHCEQFGW